jgi:N-acetylglucosamine-6-phosphate deacetylase
METNTTLFINATIYTLTGVVENGVLLVRNGSICEIVDPSWRQNIDDGTVDEIVDVRGMHLVPGFVDVHVHGGGGYDVMSGRVDDIVGMSRFHAGHGTTSFLATTLTADRESIELAIQSVLQAMKQGTGGAEVLGVHLEGPFINEARRGAQNPAFIRPGTVEELSGFIAASQRNIRLMTMAPEGLGATDVIRYAVGEGVTVSIGHSDADYETVRQAVQCGATHVTHLFNGMSPLHHRKPGVAGAAMMIDELSVELICDGHHVHPELISYIFRSKPADRVVLITDAVSVAGLPEGNEYDLGGLPCYMKRGQVRLKSTDDLAGSCLTMDQALLNTMKYTKLSLNEILPALTINPARQIGAADRKGSIEIGKDADLIILDHDYNVTATYVKGKNVFPGRQQ